MEYIAALSILAFIGFLAFRNKDLLKQKSNVDPKISKVFLVLIIFIPLILVALYSMKLQNRGIAPLYNNFDGKKEYQEPTIPKSDDYYDAPAGREEGYSL